MQTFIYSIVVSLFALKTLLILNLKAVCFSYFVRLTKEMMRDEEGRRCASDSRIVTRFYDEEELIRNQSLLQSI